MKRIYIATLATALVLLSGCNKDNNDLTDIELDNTTDLQFIKLGGSTGAASAMTRASIESLDEMTDSMGIFCLAGRTTDVKSAQGALAPNWAVEVCPPSDPKYTEKYGSTTNGRYWSNVCCEIVDTKVDEGTLVGKIEPVADPRTYYSYYPTTSVYGYDFYGYYPYQVSWSKKMANKDSVWVDITIDGTQDVIYGQSEKIDTCQWFKEYFKGDEDSPLRKTLAQSYYSARFFRKHPLLREDARMNFEHKLARFVFWVYPGPDKELAPEKTYSAVDSLCVKEISIKGVEKNLRLVVADKSGKKRSGALYASDSQKSDFILCHKDGGYLEDAPVELSTQMDENGVIIPDTIPAGDCLMVLPGRSVHEMYVKLARKGDTDYEYPSETSIAISFSNPKNEDGTLKTFEAGKTYNVYLQISSIKHISATAVLESWEESDEDMDLVEFN